MEKYIEYLKLLSDYNKKQSEILEIQSKLTNMLSENLDQFSKINKQFNGLMNMNPFLSKV